jgi:hypothetical protein
MGISGIMSTRSISWHPCTFLTKKLHKSIAGRLCLHFRMFLFELIYNKNYVIELLVRRLFFAQCVKWTHNANVDSEFCMFLSVNIQRIFQSGLKWIKWLHLESVLVIETISYAHTGVFWIVTPCSFGDGHQNGGRWPLHLQVSTLMLVSKDSFQMLVAPNIIIQCHIPGEDLNICDPENLKTYIIL